MVFLSSISSAWQWGPLFCGAAFTYACVSRRISKNCSVPSARKSQCGCEHSCFSASVSTSCGWAWTICSNRCLYGCVSNDGPVGLPFDEIKLLRSFPRMVCCCDCSRGAKVRERPAHEYRGFGADASSVSSAILAIDEVLLEAICKQTANASFLRGRNILASAETRFRPGRHQSVSAGERRQIKTSHVFACSAPQLTHVASAAV